jgi:hypothetical protein
MSLLRLDAQGRDGTGVEPLHADGLQRLLAIAVGAVLDAFERRVDLGEQLPVPVAGAKLEIALDLRLGPIRRIGQSIFLLLKLAQGLARTAKNIVTPLQ